MMNLFLTLLVALYARKSSAHGGLANYTVGDTWYRGYDPDTPAEEQLGQPWMIQRSWASIDPIFSVADAGLACNTPAVAPPSHIPISAGANLTAVYWYWLHPVGPMTVWLAACGDAADPYASCADVVDVNALSFFKIWERGLLEGTLAEGSWYQKSFQHWDGSPDLWPVAIPASLRSGTYMVRHEIMSLHIANKPQFYPECAHLNVTGTGDALPAEEKYYARFPGVYSMSNPSINIDVYSEAMKDVKNYTIPGPPVWRG
ncbi:glycoside hydrolase family 61 protein [Apiospora kogelbergensis]|uniref:glycoside hydrolase family 61 protein n=1 Tax=Apiospora kogelbergensis TaxID=1337665 RepID=UPI0031310835